MSRRRNEGAVAVGRERHRAMATPQRAILQTASTTRGEPLRSTAGSHAGVMVRRNSRLSVLVVCAPQADEEGRLWGGAKVAVVTLKNFHLHLVLSAWISRTRYGTV